MKKNNNKKSEKEKLIKTVKKPNNAIEVEIQKSPGKTLFGKILAWSIAILTIVAPLAALIYLMIQQSGR